MTNVQYEELTLEKLEMFLLRFSDERRTGQLKIQGEGARGGRVELREGRITNVDSPFVSEGLGEIAKKMGFLSKSDLQVAIDALSRSDNAGKQLPDILLEEKLLTREALETCLRFQAESSIHSMIGFHGRISFMPGTVSPAEIELDPRDVLRRMKERDHVEEMGAAFLEVVDSGPPIAPAENSPEYEAQVEMRRIAQAAIREVALASEAMQAELDAQAAAAAEELLEDAPIVGEAPPHPAEEPPVAELAAAMLEVVDVPESPHKPRLSRVVLEICRPGASSTEALLEFALHFSRRALLFASASRGLKIAAYRMRPGEPINDAKVATLVLPKGGGGALEKAMAARIPARGPFAVADDADRALAEVVDPLPPGEAILFPIAFHERSIGMLYVDGVPPGDPGVLEELAAAVAATSGVMENKLFARLAKQ